MKVTVQMYSFVKFAHKFLFKFIKFKLKPKGYAHCSCERKFLSDYVQKQSARFEMT